MKILNKILAILLAAALMTGLSACAEKPQSDGEKIKIVCTLFPIYDWVRNLTADLDSDRAASLFGSEYEGKSIEVDTVLLYGNGSDLHSYTATASDMVEIATCDLLIYVGGESDKWIEDTLKSSPSSHRKVICLMEEMKDGLLHADHGHAEGEQCDLEHKEDFDEHVWLSLKNARFFCNVIAKALKELSPADQVLYSINEEEYVAALSALDEYLRSVVNDATFDTVVFADRYPFRYLMEDHGITCYAAFEGCSTETDASFDRIISLAQKIDELGLTAVLTTEKTSGTVAKTVIAATKTGDQQTISLNSMQSVSKKDIDGGATYLSIMEENVAALKDALN